MPHRYSQDIEKLKEITDYLDGEGWEVDTKVLSRVKSPDGKVTLHIKPGHVAFTVEDGDGGAYQGRLKMDMGKMTGAQFVKVVSRLGAR